MVQEILGGTLTSNAPGTACGTFFVVVKDKRNDKNKTSNHKRLD